MEDLNDVQREINILRAEVGLDVTTRPGRTLNSLKDQLKERYSLIPLPWMTLSEHDVYVKNNIRRLMRDEEEQNALDQLQGRAVRNSEVKFWQGQKTFICKEKYATFGYCFDRQDYNRQEPLEFNSEVDLATWECEIQWFGDSKVLSLTSTLYSFLEEYPKRGYGNYAIADQLYQFISKYVPDLQTTAYTFYKQRNGTKLFELLTESIDPTLEKKKVNDCRSRIVRKPGAGIYEVMASLRNLGQQLLIVTNLYLDSEVCDKKSEKIALMSLKDFVTSGIYTRYEKWMFEKISQGQKPSFTDICRKITEFEEKHPELKISTTHSIVQRQIDPSMVAEVNTFGGARPRYGRNRDWRQRSQGDSRRGQRGGDWSSRSPSEDRRVFNRNPQRDSVRRGRRDERDDRRSSSSRRFSSEDTRYNSSSRDRRGDLRSQRGRRDRGDRFEQDRSFSRDRNRSFSSNRDRGFASSRDRSFSSRRRDFSSDRRFSRDDRQKRDSSQNSNRSLSRQQGSDRDRSRDRGRSPSGCLRCGSSSHKADFCFRYKKRTNQACRNCLRVKNLRLYHDEKHCLNSKTSRYRSPSSETRSYRVNRIKRLKKRLEPLN